MKKSILTFLNIFVTLLIAFAANAQVAYDIGPGYFNGHVFANFTSPATTGAGSATNGPIQGSLAGNNFTVTFDNIANLRNGYILSGAAIWPAYQPSWMPPNHGWPNNTPTVDLNWFDATTFPPATSTATITFTSNLSILDHLHIIDVDSWEAVRVEFYDAANNLLPIAGNIMPLHMSDLGNYLGGSSPLVTYANSFTINESILQQWDSPDEGWSFVMLSANIKKIVITQISDLGSWVSHTWDFTFSKGAPDRGDATASYGSASHLSLDNHLKLGSLGGDTEAGELYSADAQGDDNSGLSDEDGVAPLLSIKRGPATSSTSNIATYTVTDTVTNNTGKPAVTATGVTPSGVAAGPAYQVAWIDWNNNGQFETNEAATVATIPSDDTPTTRTFTWSAASLDNLVARNGTYLRIRVSNNSGLTASTPTGYLEGIGEVSDFLIKFVIDISGTVYDDGNGVTGGVNGATMSGVTVTLFGTDGATVLATTTTDANGNYSFLNIDAAAGNYTVAVTAPAGYLHVSSTDATPTDGKTSVSASNTSTGVNFGIERLPNSDYKTTMINKPAQNGFITLNGGSNPPFLTGSDPEDQPASATLSAKKVAITALPNYGQLWYNGSQVTGPVTISNFNPSLLQFKATGVGYTSTTFEYAYVDLAGKQDPTPATYTLTWTTPLPLVLENFTATKQGCDKITLAWKTGSSISFNNFSLESSVDGLDFQPVATILYSSSVTDYSYKDMDKGIGRYYYRLKMIDDDGSFRFSPIVSVIIGCQEKAISVYPNPVKSSFTIAGLTGGEQLQLYTANGQLLTSKKPTAKHEEFQLDKYPPGIYVLVVTDENNKKLSVIKINKTN